MQQHRTSYCLPQSYILIATALCMAKELYTYFYRVIHSSHRATNSNNDSFTAKVLRQDNTFKATVLHTYSLSATFTANNATFTAIMLHIQQHATYRATMLHI